MNAYKFPGFSVYLQDAARKIGHPEAEGPARSIKPLSALANLCAQANIAEPKDVPAILAKAEEFRDQLHAAYQAAELVLAEVHQALKPKPAPEPPPAPTKPMAKASRPPAAKEKKP